MATKCVTELLSGVSKHKNVVICLVEKIHVNLCPGMNFRAVMSVNELMIYIK